MVCLALVTLWKVLNISTVVVLAGTVVIAGNELLTVSCSMYCSIDGVNNKACT